MVDAFACHCKRRVAVLPETVGFVLPGSGMFEIRQEEEYPEIADEFVRACRE
jgi:hypothetical protein